MNPTFSQVMKGILLREIEHRERELQDADIQRQIDLHLINSPLPQPQPDREN